MANPYGSSLLGGAPGLQTAKPIVQAPLARNIDMPNMMGALMGGLQAGQGFKKGIQDHAINEQALKVAKESEQINLAQKYQDLDTDKLAMETAKINNQQTELENQQKKDLIEYTGVSNTAVSLQGS